MVHLAAAIAKAAQAAPALPNNLKTSDHSIFGPIAKPIAEILAGFYSVVPNFGVAIILLSLAWMIIIAPLTLKSTRSMLAMQKLQPLIKKLQAEHKNDRQAFAAAQMELYKEHNVSPFGSCLPSLLPLPVFFALFRVIDGLSHTVKYQGHTYAVPSFLSPHTQMYKAIQASGGKINAFGLDLSKNALSGHSSFLAAAPYFVLLLVMIGTQYLQTAQMMNRNPAAADNPQMKFMKYLPIFFGVICARFPAGVVLYYAVSNICRISQQTLMYRYDPKVKALVVQDVIEVEETTRKIDRGESITDKPSKSRFRDLLANASEQSARAKEERDKAKGVTPRPKPGGATSAKGRPTPPRNRPPDPKAAKTNGAATKRTAPPAKAGPPAAKAGPPAKANPPAKAGPPAAKAAPAAAKTAPPAKTTPPAAKPAQADASPVKAAPPAKPKPSPAPKPQASPTNGAISNGAGTNGNGSTTPPPAASGTGRTGAGRTGAQPPRTRRRRSR